MKSNKLMATSLGRGSLEAAMPMSLNAGKASVIALSLWLCGISYAVQCFAKSPQHYYKKEHSESIQAKYITPGSIYEHSTPGEESGRRRLIFDRAGKTFKFVFTSTGIGYDGGYEVLSNELRTWDLELPDKTVQRYTIGKEQLVNKNDGTVYRLLEMKKMPNPFFRPAAAPLSNPSPAPVSMPNIGRVALADPSYTEKVALPLQASAAWQVHYHQAEQFLLSGKWREAEFSFTSALSAADKSGATDREIAKILQQLLKIADEHRDYAKANSLLVRYQKMMEKTYGRSDARTRLVVEKRLAVLKLLNASNSQDYDRLKHQLQER